MIYSLKHLHTRFGHELVARKARFGQIWSMPATLHGKFNPKLNIIETCEGILNPTVPMPLRLSGVPMEDVNRLLVERNESWKTKATTSDLTGLPKNKYQAKREAVTLPKSCAEDLGEIKQSVPYCNGTTTFVGFQQTSYFNMRLHSVDETILNQTTQGALSTDHYQVNAANITLSDDYNPFQTDSNAFNHFERIDIEGDEEFTPPERTDIPSTLRASPPPPEEPHKQGVNHLLVERNEPWKTKVVYPTWLPNVYLFCRRKAVKLPKSRVGDLGEIEQSVQYSNGTTTFVGFQQTSYFAMRLDSMDDTILNQTTQGALSTDHYQVNAANITLSDDYNPFQTDSNAFNHFERFDIEGDEEFTPPERTDIPSTLRASPPPPEEPHKPDEISIERQRKDAYNNDSPKILMEGLENNLKPNGVSASKSNPMASSPDYSADGIRSIPSSESGKSLSKILEVNSGKKRPFSGSKNSGNGLETWENNDLDLGTILMSIKQEDYILLAADSRVSSKDKDGKCVVISDTFMKTKLISSSILMAGSGPKIYFQVITSLVKRKFDNKLPYDIRAIADYIEHILKNDIAQIVVKVKSGVCSYIVVGVAGNRLLDAIKVSRNRYEVITVQCSKFMKAGSGKSLVLNPEESRFITPNCASDINFLFGELKRAFVSDSCGGIRRVFEVRNSFIRIHTIDIDGQRFVNGWRI